VQRFENKGDGLVVWRSDLILNGLEAGGLLGVEK
jgi:hypothetical protein